MIVEENLAQQFTAIVEQSHPQVWKLLRHCYVKVINPYSTRARVPHLPYIGIYCPDRLIAAVAAEKNILREVATFVGLVEVICLNATHIACDPLSNLKQTDPQFWLELLWISTQSE
ncbi:hypothetical protein [Calothrix sp. NIES-2098]|uniref:hypothetical protein n=1 Tax=Calothrix sp. NIES-2098 TaxID=1954171 RepID=UPI000B619919|nr:hypothetical protein NIES2098_25460 [Calothrix sp. NIES-2098]